MERFKNIILVADVYLILAGNVVLKDLPAWIYRRNQEHASDYNIDPLFVVSVIRVESRFAADATSHKTPRD